MDSWTDAWRPRLNRGGIYATPVAGMLAGVGVSPTRARDELDRI
jgi:hypothetical protein